MEVVENFHKKDPMYTVVEAMVELEEHCRMISEIRKMAMAMAEAEEVEVVQWREEVEVLSASVQCL